MPAAPPVRLPPAAPIPSAALRWLPFVVVAAVYAAFALHQLTRWGVYMDEVDPDYLAVRLLNWSDPPVPAWVLPGNYLGDRFPVLVSLQHGTQTLWLGLPGFWLFGTTVAGLRITHALFALGVLAATYAYLQRAPLRTAAVALACVALAADPAFVYAFRTQSYITTAPVAWLMLALYSLARTGTADPDRRARWLAASGFFAGTAFAGYFVHLFFAPAIAVAVLAWPAGERTPRERLRHLALWCAGYAVGTLPYVVGYALLAKSQGGVAGGWTYFVQTQAELGGQGAPLSLAGRLDNVATLAELTFSNSAHHWVMFGGPAAVPGSAWKIALLLGAPPLLWLAAELRGRATPHLRLVLGMVASFAAFAFAFAGRLGGHHYAPLVPLAYAALALGLAAHVGGATWRSVATWAYALPFVALAGLNVAGEAAEAATLRATGGVGLYSDAINAFSDDVAREHPRDFVVLPDWGLMMPAVFLTGGRVETTSIDDFDEARRRLCSGRDVTVALITGDRAARLADWQRRLGWSAPATKSYRQRDGTEVFVVGTFYGRDSAGRCAGKGAAAPAAR